MEFLISFPILQLVFTPKKNLFLDFINSRYFNQFSNITSYRNS